MIPTENKKIFTTLCILFLVCILFLKLNTLYDPHSWDALGYVIPTAYDTYEHHFRLIHPDYDTGHPPLMFITLALIWKIFGISLLISHLYILIMGLIGLYFTYKLGEYLFNPVVGLGATILLAFNQIFFSQIGILNTDIPLLTLSVLTVYFYLRKERILFLIFATLLVLTKETAAIVILALFVYFYVEKFIQTRKITLNDVIYSILFALPLIPLFSFIIYHKYALGWTLNTQLIAHKSDFLSQFKLNMFRWFMWDTTDRNVNQYNFIIIGFITASILQLKITKVKLTYFLFSLIILLHVALFSYTDDVPRYFAPILPFFYLLSAQSIYLCLPKWNRNLFYFALICGIAFLFTTNYTGERQVPAFVLESNMEYRDLLETHKEAAQYIETNFPDEIVLTAWPMTNELSSPYEGYVSKPIQISTDYSPSAGNATLVYFSPQSSDAGIMNQLKKENLTLIKRFEKNGKYAEIYRYSLNG